MATRRKTGALPPPSPAAGRSVEEPRGRYLVAPRGANPPAAARGGLLDVNVLIALLDIDHVHHARATTWLDQHIAAGWASCAITQNGCVRIMSQPGYPNALPTAQVAERLREATEGPHHAFVPSDLSLLDARHYDAGQLLGHRQVTDAYLLGLAVAHGLRFVTFDAAVSLRSVRGAKAEHLVAL